MTEQPNCVAFVFLICSFANRKSKVHRHKDEIHGLELKLIYLMLLKWKNVWCKPTYYNINFQTQVKELKCKQ